MRRLIFATVTCASACLVGCGGEPAEVAEPLGTAVTYVGNATSEAKPGVDILAALVVGDDGVTEFVVCGQEDVGTTWHGVPAMDDLVLDDAESVIEEHAGSWVINGTLSDGKFTGVLANSTEQFDFEVSRVDLEQSPEAGLFTGGEGCETNLIVHPDGRMNGAYCTPTADHRMQVTPLLPADDFQEWNVKLGAPDDLDAPTKVLKRVGTRD